MGKWITPGVLAFIRRAEGPSKPPTGPRTITRQEATDLNMANLILSLRRNMIFDYEDTFVFTLKSKFTFGKFKNNELRNVWKVAPEYVEWCMINADGFVIEPAALVKIQMEPVIQDNFLGTLLSGNQEQITIDLTSYPINSNGFRVCASEVGYELADEALRLNEKKLVREAHPLTVVKGSQWGDNKAVVRLPRRLSFVIRG